MNIWYINHYAGGPGIGPAYRPFELASAWQRQGHTATAFVASFHHHLSCDGLKPGLFEAGGVRYCAVPTPRYTGNGLSRLINIASFARGLLKEAARVPGELAKPDVIIASSPHPFAIYPAHALAKRFAAKLVFEIRDIWPLSITEITRTPPWHPFVLACARAERFAYTHAGLIASVLPRAKSYLDENGWGDKPFVWVPNGAAPARESAATSANALKAIEQIRAWRRQGKTVLVHAGSIGPPNGLVPLIDAVCGSGAGPFASKLAIVLLGSGLLEEELKTRSMYATCDVMFAGRVAKDEVGAIVREASFGYAGVNNYPKVYKYGVSLNKLADYLTAAVPVFLPIAACGEPVSEAQAGLVRAVASVSEMREALTGLVAIPEAERQAMGERGRHYMQSEYDYGAIAARYAAAMEAVRAPSQ